MQQNQELNIAKFRAKTYLDEYYRRNIKDSIILPEIHVPPKEQLDWNIFGPTIKDWFDQIYPSNNLKIEYDVWFIYKHKTKELLKYAQDKVFHNYIDVSKPEWRLTNVSTVYVNFRIVCGMLTKIGLPRHLEVSLFNHMLYCHMIRYDYATKWYLDEYQGIPF